RSGTFWPFFALVKKLRAEGRGPKLLVLENVCGALTSHGGKDFSAICDALADEGYNFGALVIDAALFLPQSRPRLFIVAVREDVAIPPGLISEVAFSPFYSRGLVSAHAHFRASTREKWRWWRIAPPPKRNFGLAEIVEEEPSGVAWHSHEQTQALIAKMSSPHLMRLGRAQNCGHKIFGTAFKRMRKDKFGNTIQRTEIRFDGTSGCLRTPAGGSSRQILFVVNGGEIKSRLLSGREAARLMGLQSSYSLPERHNEALHLLGDGVAVPVVRFLDDNLLKQMLCYIQEEITSKRKAAVA
ncbi:MAG TPA: DNA cytosine methyltransferase, partial [Methylobacter sp.]